MEKPLEEPPPIDVPTEPEHQGATAAGLWQRMMEHAISAAATSWCAGSVGTSRGGGSSKGLSIDMIEPIIRYELASGAGGCPLCGSDARRIFYDQ